MQDKPPPLLGDDLDFQDFQRLEADSKLRRAAAQEVHCCLRTRDASNGDPVDRSDTRPTAGSLSRSESPDTRARRPPSASEIAAAKLAQALGNTAAEELLARWGEDVLAALPDSEDNIIQQMRKNEHDVSRCDELGQLRRAREEAYQRFVTCTSRKQAAHVALEKAMNLEITDDEADVDDWRAPSCGAPSEPAGSEVGLEDQAKTTKKKKGWGGAKKFMGKIGIGGKPSKRLDVPSPAIAGASASTSPRGATQRTGSRTPPTSPRPQTPKELMVEAASDELVESAQEIQCATEEMDKFEAGCLEKVHALARHYTEVEVNSARGMREAVRQGVMALEEWADEVRAAVGLHSDVHFDASTSAGSPSSVGASPSHTQSSSASEAEEEGKAEGKVPIDAVVECPGLKLQVGEDPELQAQLASSQTDALLRRVSPMLRARGLCSQMASTTEVLDSQSLAALNSSNALLEQSLRETRPRNLALQLRQCRRELDKEVTRLEGLAAVVGAASGAEKIRMERYCEQQQLGGSSSSTSSPSRSVSPTIQVHSLGKSGSGPQTLNKLSIPPMPSRTPSPSASRDGGSSRHTPWRPPTLSSLVEHSNSSHPNSDLNTSGQVSPSSPAFGSGQGLRSGAQSLRSLGGRSPRPAFADPAAAAAAAARVSVDSGFRRTNPFGSDEVKSLTFATDAVLDGNPFDTDKADDAGNFIDRHAAEDSSNPFTLDEPEDHLGNPFGSDAEDAVGNPFGSDAVDDSCNSFAKGASDYGKTFAFADELEHGGNPFNMSETVDQSSPFDGDTGQGLGAAFFRDNGGADGTADPGEVWSASRKRGPKSEDSAKVSSGSGDESESSSVSLKAKSASGAQASRLSLPPLPVADDARTSRNSAPRLALAARPAALNLVVSSAPSSDALESGMPRMASVTSRASASEALRGDRSPRQQPSLAGCLASSASSGANVTVAEVQSPESDITVYQAEKFFSASSLEIALAKSDAALCKGRLGPDDGYWNWEWVDHQVEEGHMELHRSSLLQAEILTDDDWSLFAYEQLLLCRHMLSDADPALEHLTGVLPVCRVKLGINSLVHHRLAELSAPDGSEALLAGGLGFSIVDVRFRLTLLLRAWARAETSFGVLVGPHEWPEWTTSWVRRQLAVLKGSVIERSVALHHQGRAEVRSTCNRCLKALRRLDKLAEEGLWGKSQKLEELSEPGGRRLLAALSRDLDALRPVQGDWHFGCMFAARVFGKLWRAATDADSEDHLSLDAPLVAAALLSGVHPYMTTLQLDTHALLLAQQLWVSLSMPSAASPSKNGSGVVAVYQLPGKALAVAASLLEDFSQWLQGTPVDAASCFARRATVYGDASAAQRLAEELAARRLMTVELRDGLVESLKNYRRNLEPEAFRPALELWRRSHRQTRRSELLPGPRRRADTFGRSDEDLEPELSEDEGATPRRQKTETGEGSIGDDEDEELIRRFGHWFVWRSASATAELVLSPFDSPQQVPPGDADAWRRMGPRIKKHLEGLTAAVKSLMDELQCELRFYNKAWICVGQGQDHLGVAAAAMAAAVRPRLRALLSSGIWPTADYGSAVLEVPAGGGRLLQALEALDREARRRPEPRVRPPEPGASSLSLVDVLLSHVTSALSGSLASLDRDVTSHALDGSEDTVFVPLRPPALLYCEGVVTLWRFIHDALDAPLSLGVPVDIVVRPFVTGFLGQVLDRTGQRLVRSCENLDSFRMALRAAQIAGELANTEYIVNSDEEVGAEDAAKRSGGRKRTAKNIWGKVKEKVVDDIRKNTIIEAGLLEVEPRVVAPPIRQVIVRLTSVGFCLSELGGVYSKLVNEVNSGDDSACPTMRHNDARRLICEELPDLQEALLERGQCLVRYLAARLVYFELRAELFERLYFHAPAQTALGGVGTPAGAAGSVTPSVTTPIASSAEGSSCLTLEAIVSRRQDSFLGLIEETPAPLLVSLVVELGTHLTHAWTYVILDYLRRQKLDQVAPYLDDDQDALKRTIGDMMRAARRRLEAAERVQGGAGQQPSGQQSLNGLSADDCKNGERKLDEVQRVAQSLILKAHSGTAEELARYAAKVRGDLPQADTNGLAESAFGIGERPPTPPVRERSQTPVGRGRSPPAQKARFERSASPAAAAASTTASTFLFAGRSSGARPSSSPSGPSPSPSPRGEAAAGFHPGQGDHLEDSSNQRAPGKPMWARAWKATKKGLGGHKGSSSSK
ncbi:unnamed protein product [Polarella glacialis]|uniref:Uncharacterized protein n=1 Tax=Polarella glacialis TaxID=89957 RepID=A0A813KG13_POLGL|nr:unnamed protein product [Polarella glacialis]